MTHDDTRIESLDESTCRRILDQHRFGRIAVTDEFGPIIFPVNYAVRGDRIVFRTEPGTKLLAAGEGQSGCFELDDVDEARRFGWDVVVRGTLGRVQDGAEMEMLGDDLPEPFAGGRREHVIALTMETVSGRRIPLSSEVSDDWYRAPDLGHIWYGRDASDLMG
jgi:uncharacterized protein